MYDNLGTMKGVLQVLAWNMGHGQRYNQQREITVND